MNYNTYLTPSCEILVNGQKRKLYGKNKNKIYLNDGDEFQIKVYNPFTKRIGFQLKLNGTDEDNSLLVINPGQSVIVERFIGTNKKLKFSTYLVDKNNPVTQKAIKNNGRLEIIFWDEFQFVGNGTITITNPWIPTTTPYTPPSTIPYIPYVPPTWPIVYCDTPIINSTGSFTTNNLGLTGDANQCFSKSVNSNTTTLNLAETGRIEKGDKSKQHFSETNFISGTIIKNYVFKLLPFSEKPKEQIQQPVQSPNPYILQNSTSYVKTEGRDYCPNKRCNYRIRKTQYGWCPMCGTKLD